MADPYTRATTNLYGIGQRTQSGFPVLKQQSGSPDANGRTPVANTAFRPEKRV